MHYILLVDDDPALLRSLQRGFNKEHPEWSITSVPSAALAIKEIAERNYGLVITDWLFGNEKLNGTDVLMAAKARDPLAMCIVITAHQGSKLNRYEACFAHGAYDVIVKGSTDSQFSKEVKVKASAAMKLREVCLNRSSLARHLDRRVVEAYEIPGALKFSSRWLTIAFCDVRGFSKINNQLMGANALVANFLKDIYNKVIEVTSRWGGIVDKFMGDGAMLLFGAATPVPHALGQQKKDACNAIRAALELQIEVRAIFAEFEEEFKSVTAEAWNGLELGVGIHSAEVLVGLIETEHRDQFTALGHGVNLAQRFESAAGRLVGEGAEGRRGNILISNPVKARIGNRFKLKDEGVLTDLRNIDGHQSAWSVESESPPVDKDD